MRVLDKILYKAKLQTGGNLAGKVIKKEDGYFENPDGIANSPTIDRKNYTSIDKTKVNKGVYNYKGVDYLLDYIPTNMTSYGVSETYTKPAAPATTSTNTVPSNPKFMPKAHFSTDMALSPNKPLVLGINKDKGVFQRASVEAENNFPLTRGTVQQSANSSNTQPVSTPVTTTIPEKKKGLFNRIFGKRDNKLTTSDNATNTTSTSVATTQNPTQQATTNNAVVTEDGYSINEDGILLRYGKPTDLSPTENDEARARVIAKQKDLQSTQTSNIASQTNNVPTGQTTIPKANVGNNNTSSATSANRNPNVNPTSQLPITTTQTSVSDNANQIPTIGDVPTIKTNTGVNTTINQEAELSESAKNNNRYVYDDYNNVIYRPDGSKAELTSRQKRDLFYYRDNSDLPLNANKERAARIHGEQEFYKTLVGSNEKEGKAIAEKPTTDVMTDALYNGKDWNKDIYSFESKSGVVITPDGTRVTLPPDIAKDVRKSIGIYNNSGSPNEKEIQNAIRQGVEKVTNSSSPTSSTNKPTPVTEIKLPANSETPTSSQPKPVPVLGTDTPIKPVVGFPAQQPTSVQPGVSTQSSQNIAASPGKHTFDANTKTITKPNGDKVLLTDKEIEDMKNYEKYMGTSMTPAGIEYMYRDATKSAKSTTNYEIVEEPLKDILSKDVVVLPTFRKGLQNYPVTINKKNKSIIDLQDKEVVLTDTEYYWLQNEIQEIANSSKPNKEKIELIRNITLNRAYEAQSRVDQELTKKERLYYRNREKDPTVAKRFSKNSKLLRKIEGRETYEDFLKNLNKPDSYGMTEQETIDFLKKYDPRFDLTAVEYNPYTASDYKTKGFSENNREINTIQNITDNVETYKRFVELPKAKQKRVVNYLNRKAKTSKLGYGYKSDKDAEFGIIYDALYPKKNQSGGYINKTSYRFI